MTRPFVIVESPFRAKGGTGPDPQYLVYLRRALRDSFNAGEHPFASHAFYPFWLRESIPEERIAGIEFGYWYWPLAEQIVFYNDYGMSTGMQLAFDRAVHMKKRTSIRMIGTNDVGRDIPAEDMNIV